VLDKNHITATVTPVLPSAMPSATPDIIPPEQSSPMSPEPAETIPAINTATRTLLPGQMTRSSLESLVRERELSIANAQQAQEAMANIVATFE
jgi:hypothetical protein